MAAAVCIGQDQREVANLNTCEIPVILVLPEITANTGQKVGTLIDLAADPNYLTHDAARRLRLQSERVTLVVQGIRGMTMEIKPKRYSLKVRIKTPRGTDKAHKLVCYRLDCKS